MEALINISENKGQKLVSARELYENLGVQMSLNGA
jgi:phage anti-repressor protein